MKAAVALGSNLGDRLATLRHAVEELARVGHVTSVSSLYETAPVGGPEQGAYLNAVVVLEASLEPDSLLDELNRIEAGSGRVRAERWGPRTLDLDLIAVSDDHGASQRMATDRLILPHPRAHLRRFVIEPLAEVWPTAELGNGVAAEQLRTTVEDQGVESLGSGWVDDRMPLARWLVGIQMLLLVSYGIVVVVSGRLPVSFGPRVGIGALAAAVGFGVCLWGAASLGTSLWPYPEPRPGTTLVMTGPYRYVRHPIYAGLVLGLVGFALLAGSTPGVLVAAGIGAFFWFKARYEETRLRLAVPGYASYQRRVRGRLFPALLSLVG